MKPITPRGLISQMAHIFCQLCWTNALCRLTVIFQMLHPVPPPPTPLLVCAAGVSNKGENKGLLLTRTTKPSEGLWHSSMMGKSAYHEPCRISCHLSRASWIAACLLLIFPPICSAASYGPCPLRENWTGVPCVTGNSIRPI